MPPHRPSLRRRFVACVSALAILGTACIASHVWGICYAGKHAFCCLTDGRLVIPTRSYRDPVWTAWGGWIQSPWGADADYYLPIPYTRATPQFVAPALVVPLLPPTIGLLLFVLFPVFRSIVRKHFQGMPGTQRESAGFTIAMLCWTVWLMGAGLRRYDADQMLITLLGLSALLTSFIILIVRAIRSRLVPPPGHCQRCGYNLTGNVSGRCPECGTAIGNHSTTVNLSRPDDNS